MCLLMSESEILACFNSGGINSACILLFPDGDVVVNFSGVSGTDIRPKKQRGGVRVFKSLDAAVSFVAKVGLHGASISWGF